MVVFVKCECEGQSLSLASGDLTGAPSTLISRLKAVSSTTNGVETHDFLQVRYILTRHTAFQSGKVWAVMLFCGETKKSMQGMVMSNIPAPYSDCLVRRRKEAVKRFSGEASAIGRPDHQHGKTL